MAMNPVLTNPVLRHVLLTQRIHLIAPASGIAPADMQHLQQQLAEFNVMIPQPLISDVCPFHANSDEKRFEQLVAALYDDLPQTIIWSLRGGYGSARLLERLNRMPKPKQEKIFIGFSDNTALHLFLSQKWRWQTIHACGLAQLIDAQPRDPNNFIRIAEILSQQVTQQTLTGLKPMNQMAQDTTSVSGVMQGGNLTLVESSLATFWQAETQDSILFLEEVGEKGYRIDRSLQHLKQAGLLAGVRALVFGECIGPDVANIAYALQRFAEETPLPVYQTKQFGHGISNYPIVYGAQATLVVDTPASATLTMIH